MARGSDLSRMSLNLIKSSDFESLTDFLLDTKKPGVDCYCECCLDRQERKVLKSDCCNSKTIDMNKAAMILKEEDIRHIITKKTHKSDIKYELNGVILSINDLKIDLSKELTPTIVEINTIIKRLTNS
jgi:hypothetical protein